jgi:anti-sigma28 factor (negative regulator of flagellin synthesis)
MGEMNPVSNSKASATAQMSNQRPRVQENADGAQLSRLSSVLNGLESGAVRMCGQVQQAMRAVRSGTYQVDALKLSRRIVGEALGPA